VDEVDDDKLEAVVAVDDAVLVLLLLLLLQLLLLNENEFSWKKIVERTL
jgi:hypothetical protein